MSKKLAAFLEEVKKNAEMREKLSANKEMDGVLAIAKEYGFDLTEEDFQVEEELNEDELAQTAGGQGAVGCVCVVAGGGGGTDAVDGKTYGCACVVYGQGGDGRAKDDNCVCALGGGGSEYSAGEEDPDVYLSKILPY